MYNQPYFIPGYYSSLSPNMMRSAGNALAQSSRVARGGLLNKLGAGLSSIRSLNWSGLINNTSKTLNVVNQAIPLVRQVGPMYNNMKSMFKVASAFKSETNMSKRNNRYRQNTSQSQHFNGQNNTINSSSVAVPNNISTNYQQKSNNNNSESEFNTNSNFDFEDNSPVFFIE